VTKTYHQLAIEHPGNAGYRMMADRERLMMDDPNDTLAQLRELRERHRLGACTHQEAVTAADIISNEQVVDMALELGRTRSPSK
jgi:hypothetical protein